MVLLTGSPSLQDVCMMNLFVSCSCTFTVKDHLWIMSWQRNRTSFVFLEPRVSLIWRVLLVWLWWKHQLYVFQFPWTSHLGPSCRFLVSSVRVVPHRFYLLPSYFFFRVLPKWHILSVYFSVSLACVHICTVFVFFLSLRNTVKTKVHHYRRSYSDCPDPITRGIWSVSISSCCVISSPYGICWFDLR